MVKISLSKKTLALIKLFIFILVLTTLIYLVSLAGFLHSLLVFTAYLVSLIFLFWGLYHIPILAAGLTKIKCYKDEKIDPFSLPTMTILIPAKHEPWVVSRVVNVALNHLSYPKSKKEIVVVTEDEETFSVVLPVALANPDTVKVFIRSASSRVETKPAALNDIVHLTRGEIICIFDVEDMPEKDVLLKVAPIFKDPKVGAVQGILRISNTKDSWISRMMGLEYASWFRISLWGRVRLGFFAPLGGTCCFIRREYLRMCGWWDSKNLTEDLEVTARLVLSGAKVEMVEVRSWEEAPTTIRKWLRQRGRWMRGYLQTFLRYWKIALKNVRRLGLKMALTMILSMATPFVMIFVPIGFLLTFLWIITDVLKIGFPGLMTSVFPDWAIIPLLFNFIFYGGVVAAILIEDKNYWNLLWVPVFFIYMFLHIAGVLYAIWLHLTKPIYWAKTEHYGYGVKGFPVISKKGVKV